jgi:hypothetical protein
MRKCKHILALLLLALLLCQPLTGAALATGEPEVEAPDEETVEYAYTITMEAPEGWYTDAAQLTIQITDVYGTGWDAVEICREGDEKWTALDSDLVYEITQNGTYTVRITDPTGKTHEQSQTIQCFDTTAPTVTAGIQDKVLHTQAKDSQSGVYGIQVDGNLFTTLEDGALDLRLADYTNAGKTFSVVAIDNMGNCSEAVVIDNPYYTSATPAPTATPVVIYTGTQTAATTTTASQTASTSTGTTATVAATSTTSTATTTQTEATPTPTTEVTQTEGTGFQANGNAVTRDLLYDQYTNKQFISLQTRDGSTFYLVIDYDKPQDEDSESYETYFLNLVDNNDLTALLGETVESAQPEVCICANQCVVGSIDTTCPVCRTDLSQCLGVAATPQPEPTAVPAETEPVQENTTSGGNGTVAVILVLALAAGGAVYFLKFKKDKPKTAGDTDLDEYDFGEEDEQDDMDE